jgi:hypothetical protein
MEFKPSGKTIHDHTDTIDTGERKEMFGYTARRVLTRNRQTRDTQVLRESECDGWYIDPPAAWLSLHPPPKAGLIYRLRMSSGDQPRDDYKFTESGTIETGFVMLATRRHKSLFHDENGNSRVHESIHRDEVVEFSEGLLGPDLFVPPRDFKRVPQIPDGVSYALAYRMQLRWAMLKDSLSLPNRIAGFTASR